MSRLINGLIEEIKNNSTAIELRGLTAHELVCDIVKAYFLEEGLNYAGSVVHLADLLGSSRTLVENWSEDYGVSLDSVKVEMGQGAKKDPLHERLKITPREYAVLRITKEFPLLRELEQLGLSVFHSQLRIANELDLTHQNDWKKRAGLPLYYEVIRDTRELLGTYNAVNKRIFNMVTSSSLASAVKNKTGSSKNYREMYSFAKTLGLYKNKPEIDELIDPNKLL